MVQVAEKTVAETIYRAPAADGKAKARLDFIDGLRGFACLYVVMYHLFLLWPVASHSTNGLAMQFLGLLTRVAAYGHVGVDVFLALSGFCLFYPLCVRSDTGTESPAPLGLGPYARRRASRILPPYLSALFIFSLLPLWPAWATDAYPLPTIAQFASHLLLMHNVYPNAVLSIDGPLWSLALEAQLYLLFPLLVALFRRMGPSRFALSVSVAAIAFRLGAWYLLGGHVLTLEGQFALMDSLPGRFFEFAAGMVAAYLLTRPQVGEKKVRLGLVAVAAIVGGAALAYGADKRFGEHSPLPTLLWGVVAFGLIVGARPSGLRPLRLFESRWIVRIGLISYSIYLVHEPVLRLTGAFVRQIGLTSIQAFSSFVFVGAPVLLGLCVLFYWLFERPFVRHSSNARGAATRLSERLAKGTNP